MADVLDILQGFWIIIYAIIEIMSQSTVMGGADFLEGAFFTGLIVYFIDLGQKLAASIVGDTLQYTECTNPISRWWSPLLPPLSAVSWSGLFQPKYVDFPMVLHDV